MQQLLGLVEGLEEELFNAEARRHDAEVEVRPPVVHPLPLHCPAIRATQSIALLEPGSQTRNALAGSHAKVSCITCRIVNVGWEGTLRCAQRTRPIQSFRRYYIAVGDSLGVVEAYQNATLPCNVGSWLGA